MKCPKTLVRIYQTTWRHIQETCYLNHHCHDSFRSNLLAFFCLGEKLACRMPYLLCVCIHTHACVCVCTFTCAQAFLYEILTQWLIIVKYVLKIGTLLEAISGTFWFPLVSNKHVYYADLCGGNDMSVVRYSHSCLTFGSSSICLCDSILDMDRWLLWAVRARQLEMYDWNVIFTREIQ